MIHIYILFLIGTLPLILGSGITEMVKDFLPGDMNVYLVIALKSLAMLAVFEFFSKIILSFFEMIYKKIQLDYIKTYSKFDKFKVKLIISMSMVVHFWLTSYVLHLISDQVIYTMLVNMTLSIAFGYFVKNYIDDFFQIKKTVSE